MSNPPEPPTHDVVEILLAQHQRIRDLFRHVREASGEHRQHRFDELRALLAVHETAEEMVVRPVMSAHGAHEIADARNAEEKAANRVLADLESLDVTSPEFRVAFADLEHEVLAHAAREESEEFPVLRAKAPADQREGMGMAVLAAERLAPTHPHPAVAGSPAAQWLTGPFASLLDHARDSLRAATR
jgi:hypothetical protein